MPDQPGYMIDGRFFPMVTQYKHGDPILIHEVTGLSWDEFAELLAEAGEEGARPNPIVNTALIAVAIQRNFPTWSRRRVSDYVKNIELGSEEVVGIVESDTNGSGPNGESGDELPPAESGENSKNSEERSVVSPESPSNQNQIFSGVPGSDITSRDSPLPT